MLTTDQKQRYAEEGFLVLPDFKSARQLAPVLQRTQEIVEAFDANSTRSIFTTQEQTRSIDRYFLDSANRIRCFFEEEAFDANGALRQDKALSINKIGHALHDLDPVFEAFSRTPELHALALDLGLQVPQIWQSMVIFKQPGIGGEVGWHQDATYFHTTPETVTTFWFALEDATLDNGCLWVQKGGHRSPLRELFVRDGDQISMQKLDTQAWPTLQDGSAIEVAAGTLVVFHGRLPHYSAANRSDRSRLAYTLHVTDGRARYSPGNWIQRGPEFPVRGFV